MSMTIVEPAPCCFGIFPDGVPRPVAVFQDLEDAIDWGVRRYGSGRFGIRHVDLNDPARQGEAGN
jgi:hypothetical protein